MRQSKPRSKVNLVRSCSTYRATALFEMAAYDQYLSGDLTNYEVTDEEVANNLKDLEKII